MSDKQTSGSGFGIDRRTLLQGSAAVAAAASAGALSQGAMAAEPVTANSLKAVAVNFEPVLGDTKATAAKIVQTIEACARDGADLIVFPEGALHGFERCPDCKARGSGKACDRHLAGAELADGPLMRGIADAVRRLNVYAVVGFRERDPVKPAIYNAAAMFGPQGLIGTNRKMGLGYTPPGVGPSGEDMYAQGDRISVFPTRYGPVGVGICYDMWINPEIPRLMVLKGAKILVIPTATVSETVPGDIEAMAFTRARENMVFVINANLVRGGFEERDAGPDAKYYSHSYIAGPDGTHMGKILAKTDDPRGLVTAQIDLAQYDRYNNRSQLMKKRATGGINQHITNAVAAEFAALVGKRVV